MNNAGEMALDTLETGFRTLLDEARMWEELYKLDADGETDTVYWQTRAGALAECLDVLQRRKAGVSSDDERESQPYSPSASSRGSADGERPVDFHCKGFEKMSPELQTALVTMVRLAVDAQTKGLLPKPPHPPNGGDMPRIPAQQTRREKP